MGAFVFGGDTVCFPTKLDSIPQTEYILEAFLKGKTADITPLFWDKEKPKSRTTPTSELKQYKKIPCLLSGQVPYEAPRIPKECTKNITDIDLDKNQLKFIHKFLSTGRLIDADPPGTGKTRTVLGAVLTLMRAGYIKKAVAITRAGLPAVFTGELQKIKQVPRYMVVAGTRVRRKFIYSSFRKMKQAILIGTWDLLLHDRSLLNKLNPDMLVADESGRIRNRKTKTADTLYELWNPQFKILMNGTLFETSLNDVYNQTDFLDPHLFSNIEAFRKAHQTPDKKEFRAKLDTIAIRRSREILVPDLPKKEEQTFLCPMTALQEEAYKTEASRILARIKNPTPRSLFMFCTRLRETASVFGNKSGKLNTLQKILKQYNKVLIFTFFRGVAAFLAEHTNCFGVITGSTEKTARKTIIKKFKDSNKQVLVSTHVMAYGHNLPFLDAVILYDEWWNPAKDEQMTDRGNRRGRETSLYAPKLISQGTVEESIYNRVKHLEEFSKDFVGQDFEKIVLSTQEAEDFLMCHNKSTKKGLACGIE